MDDENKQPAFPYVPYPAFKAFIGHLNDTVVTDQIDNTMMPRKMSGGAKYAMTSALKSLGLIDEQNNTTPKLREIVAAYNSKDWPNIVKKYILSIYSDIAETFELKSATRKQVEEMFKDATPQMKDKYMRFFLSANKDAGVEYSPHLKIRRRKAAAKKRIVKLTSKKKKSAKHVNRPLDEVQDADIKPRGSFDQPIPIESEFPCYIRIPLNVNISQVELVKAAVVFIEALAKQNEERK